MEESTLISKGSCDSCGSSDANALYDDGHSFCFSCNTHKQGESTVSHVTLTSGGELDRLIGVWNAKGATAIPDRSLTTGTCSKYGVIVDGDVQMYPYFAEGITEPVGFKLRTVSTKGFRAVGDIKSAGLFGQQRFGNHDQNRIVITEGELDALAADQMFGSKTAVVSLKGGAAAAGRDVKASYNFLDGYKEIVFYPDADNAGQEAIAKIADVFAGKLRIMKLDASVGSDACDYLKKGKTEEFTRAFFSAAAYVPEGVMSKDKLWERLNAERPAAMGEYPWESLNKLTYGFRPTELVTICAGSGLGKSSILRELVMHIKATTNHRIGTLFLEESVERTAEGFMSVDLSTPVHLPTSEVKRGSEEYKQSFDRVFGDDQLLIMDAAFDTGATVEAIVSRVRYLAKALDCKVIILDHLSILVSAGQHNDERKALDSIMTNLRSLTQDTGITLFAVSHLRRPEGKDHESGAATSVGQLRGSAAIAQLSDFVIGLERNGQADDPVERNTTTMRVLKNRFSGDTGPAGHLLYSPNTGRLSEFTPPDEEEVIL